MNGRLGHRPARSAYPRDGLRTPESWIVERTFAWIGRNRRLARDFERYAGIVRVAMIRIMLRRLTATTSS